METKSKTTITIQAIVKADIGSVWKKWNTPEDITCWNYASDDWHTPRAENDLRVGGKLKSRMEAKDGSFGFDFEGTYTTVIENEKIEYLIADGRKVSVSFSSDGKHTTVTEQFEAESENPVEMQRAGWQAILDNFRKYAESAP